MTRWLYSTGMTLALMIAGALASGDAFASQGPGIAAGNASAAVQTAMAIVVYGGCAAMIAFAAIRSLMQRS